MLRRDWTERIASWRGAVALVGDGARPKEDEFARGRHCVEVLGYQCTDVAMYREPEF